MSRLVKDNKKAWLTLLSASSLVFAFTYGFAVSERTERVKEVAQLAQAHLVYALKQKDDMGVIDWSKDLEKMENVLAFQATLNQKSVIEGGNRDLLLNPGRIGTFYRSSAQWVQLSGDGAEVQNQLDFSLIYRSKPDPVLFGFVAFLFSLLLGGFGLFSAGHREELKVDLQRSILTPSAPPPAVKVLPANPLRGETEKPFLFLDHNYIIQQATAQASRLLQMNSKALVNTHLLDLTPDPRLMQAIQSSEESKLSAAFLSHPNLSVVIKPDPNGFFLFLETS